MIAASSSFGFSISTTKQEVSNTKLEEEEEEILRCLQARCCCPLSLTNLYIPSKKTSAVSGKSSDTEEGSLVSPP